MSSPFRSRQVSRAVACASGLYMPAMPVVRESLYRLIENLIAVLPVPNRSYASAETRRHIVPVRQVLGRLGTTAAGAKRPAGELPRAVLGVQLLETEAAVHASGA